MSFFSTLNFSSTNEDGETELAALAGARHVLCVTGSGTRPLDMLLSGADAVVALDANPVQNALLALKVAALERLDHADYLAFLGLADSDQRRAVYADLRANLSSAARTYWDGHKRLIAAGVWYAGQWERLLALNARFLALFRRRAVAALMRADTLDDQARIWRDGFARQSLLRTIETLGRDLVWRLVMREPAGAFLPDSRAVGDQLDRDFARASRSFLFRDSDTATIAVRGRLRSDDALPVHLRPENYERVRAALPRLRVLEGGLADLPRLDPARFDGFSLSDFGSYCGPADYLACWQGIAAVASPGARWCERLFMNAMPPPLPELTVDETLSERLSASDRAIIYRVRAGTIA
ncbi:DUF3419 family protein [Sphingomonas sp. PB4P5]|uniref:DUF3419 family protein n=1 Tax=Parasphingomonas puruogangriensis TaxID=3096155 RepID=UPI002FC9593F